MDLGVGEMQRLRGYLLLAGWLAPLALGCSEELGPERLPTAQVTGTFHVGTKPIGPGWVAFLPVNGTVGNIRSAPIAADGSFTAEGVAVGENQVGILIPGERVLSQYFDALSSSIRRKIPAGRSTLSIDLLAEAYEKPARH